METNKHLQWVKNEFIKPSYSYGDIVNTKYGLGIIYSMKDLDANGLGLTQRSIIYGVYYGMGEDKTNLSYIKALEKAVDDGTSNLEDAEQILYIAKNHITIGLLENEIFGKYE